jgi:hypothetical protein
MFARTRRSWECGASNAVTPSQGSHFFQNLTAFQVGYSTANPDAGEGSIDWQWLTAQPAVKEQGCARHLHFSQPLRLVMNSGESGRDLQAGRELEIRTNYCASADHMNLQAQLQVLPRSVRGANGRFQFHGQG